MYYAQQDELLSILYYERVNDEMWVYGYKQVLKQAIKLHYQGEKLKHKLQETPTWDQLKELNAFMKKVNNLKVSIARLHGLSSNFGETIDIHI